MSDDYDLEDQPDQDDINDIDQSDFYLSEGQDLEKYRQEQEFYELEQKKKLLNLKENLRSLTYEELIEREANRKQVEALQTMAVGNMGFICSPAYGRITEVQVLDDKKLIAPIAGKKKEVAIFHEPITTYMNMRNFWPIGGLMDRIRYFLLMIYLHLPIIGLPTYGFLKFNLYVMRTDGEYTLDPSKDWTPWELQRKTEEFLKVSAIATKAKIISNFLTDMRDQDQLNRLVAYFLIAFVLTIFMFLWVLNGGKP